MSKITKSKYDIFHYTTPILSIIVIFLYAYYTICLHGDWVFCLDQGGFEWFFGTHPLYYLACKCIALIGIILAGSLGFRLLREKDDRTRFSMTAMSVTIGAASSLISVDTYSQYVKVFPLTSPGDNTGEAFTVVDNLLHTFGVFLILLTSFSMRSQWLRYALFYELGVPATLRKIYDDHTRRVTWSKVKKALTAHGCQVDERGEGGITVQHGLDLLTLDRSCSRRGRMRPDQVKEIMTFLLRVGIEP